MSKKKSAPKLLTEVELEMMRVLWRWESGATVTDVMNALGPQRKLAYTSVSTMLRILEQKGAVQSRKEGRGHVYSASLPKKDYEEKSVKHVLEKVFDDRPLEMVCRLLEVKEFDESDLRSLRELLKERLGDDT